MKTTKFKVKFFACELADSEKGRALNPEQVVACFKYGEDFEPAQESVYLLGLNSGMGVVLKKELVRGGLNSVRLTPADVLRPVLLAGIGKVVLVHNHPSGDPSSSPEDQLFTKRVVEACELMGITLVDHVIVTPRGEFRSMRREGTM